MFGHKNKARRPLPQGILSRTMPPHKPRDNKSAEAAAKAKAEAIAKANAGGFGQNSHLHANALPMRPSSSHAAQYPPESAPATAQGYHAKAPSRSSPGHRQRELPSVFGFNPPSPPRREANKAPYPISVYGDAAQPEPQPATFGLLSSPTVLPAHQGPSSSASGHNTHEYFPPGLVHPHAALHANPRQAQASFPITPPQHDRFAVQSPGAAALNQGAFLRNRNVRVTHQSLAPSEIRLIRIAPSSSGPLRLTFVHTYVTRPLPYIAISYTWGSSKEKANIELDGHPITINTNLNQALLELRDRDRDVVCWADAICINQKDKEEVKEQVLLMRSVYSSAKSVAVWLGPASRDSDAAMSFVDNIATHGKQRNEGFIRRLIESPQHRKDFAAVVSLFQRDYWRRLWVVQEVIHGSCITVHCGSVSLPWDAFKIAADTLRRNSKHIEQHYAALIGPYKEPIFVSTKDRFSYARVLLEMGPSSFRDVRSLLGSGTTTETTFKASKFLMTIQSCRSKFATDPRDKIYGVLGLCPDEAQRATPPDYNISISEVYTKAAKYVISATRRLDIVCHALHYPVHVTSLGLPSWVPDWSHISPMTAIDWPMGRFGAGGDTQEQVTITDQNTLNILAVFVDKVRHRGIPVGTTVTVHDMLMSFLHWFSIIQARFKTQSPARLEVMEVEFCQMLVFDNMHPLFSDKAMWRRVTFHLFASLAADLLPEMPLHHRLAPYAEPEVVDLYGIDRNTLLEESFSTSMTGRSFFMTHSGHIGMGSGYLASGDSVIVPFGCSTPLIVRVDGDLGEFRLVSDAFLAGYMYGQVVKDYKAGALRATKYCIH